MICFVSKYRPVSIQARNTERYKERLQEEFKEFRDIYPDLPLGEPLYSKIVYIHKRKTDIDVDKMSKPFVDAFRGIIYSDDNIINHRICTKIRLEDMAYCEIKLDNLPEKVAEKLDEYLSNGEEHIVYYEIGKFSNNLVSIGDEWNEIR